MANNKKINFKMEINKDITSCGGYSVSCYLTDNEEDNEIIKKFEKEENENINESKDAATAYDDLFFYGKKINDIVICNVELIIKDGEIDRTEIDPVRRQ